MCTQAMNDLVEKVLHGFGQARERIARRPLVLLCVGGFAAASLTMFAGARIGAAPAALPLDTWLGLLPRAGYEVSDLVPGLSMLAGIAVLCGLWLLIVLAARGRRLDEAQLWTLAASWSFPFVLGPPLLSTDVFGYVAHGLLARNQLNPYHHGPSALGDSILVNAIDPTWRSAASTQGPLGSALEHLLVIVGADNPLAAVLLFRALAVASVVAIGQLAAELAGHRRASAIAVTVLNPLTLLYLVSAAHLDALFVALVLASLVAAAQRRWTRALLLVCIAAGLKPIGLVAVVAVVVAHSARQQPGFAWRVALRDATVALAALIASVLSVPYGLGWAANLGTVTREHTPFAPASVVSDVISVIVTSASFDDLATGGRLSLVLAGATAVAYLLVTVRARPLEHTVGYALLALGLCGPVLYPWFLSWGVLVLAPTAIRARRDWVLALSVAACVLAPAGFVQHTAERVSLAALALIGAALFACLAARRERSLRAASQSG